MKLANPLPGYCSACYGCKPEKRYVDFESAFDGAPVMDRETMSIAVLPWTGALAGHDDLYLCEDCVRDAAEELAIRPQEMARVKNEKAKAELAAEHWRAYAKRLEATLAERPEPTPRASRRGLKVAA